MRYTTALVILVVGGGFGSLSAQSIPDDEPVEARLWLDGVDEPVVQRGERVRIQYHTSFDAYTAVFRIDTDGRISLLHPSTPRQTGHARGGRDHQLLLARSPFWTVADDPGVGYLFLVASPEPLDLSSFGYHPTFGWDLSAVASAVYDDPYLAMDDFVAAMIPSWETVPYALDFVTYHVGEPRSYPRFLCYDCHTPQSYADWNPYAEMCTDYRIVIYDDPYFYPAYRYAGSRTVFPRPLPDRPRYTVAVRGGGDGWAPIVRVRAAPSRPVEFKETPVRAAAGAPVRRPASARVGAASGRVVPPSGRSTRTAVPPRASTPQPRRASPSAAGARAGVERPTPSRARPAASTPESRGSANQADGARPRRRTTPTRPSANRPEVRSRGTRPARRPTSAAPAGTRRGSVPAATARPRPAPRPSAGSRPARSARPPARAPASRPRATATPGRRPGGG
ncbi:MAG: DUF4384 domain-containing protein [Gemmatimonadota bacterium]